MNPPSHRVNPSGDGSGVLGDLEQPPLAVGAVYLSVEVPEVFPRVLLEVLRGEPGVSEQLGAGARRRGYGHRGAPAARRSRRAPATYNADTR